MRIIKSEARTTYVLAVEDAPALQSRTESSSARPLVPRKVEVPVVSRPDTADRLGPVDVHGPLVNRSGSLSSQWGHERFWPMDWSEAPEVVKAALRELGLSHLAGLDD